MTENRRQDLRAGTAQEAGLDAGQLERAYALLGEWAADGSVPGATIAVARHGVHVPTRAFGVRAHGDRQFDMEPEAVFLVASVTKPVTAMAALLQVEAGRLALGDAAATCLADFRGDGREAIQLLHLLTHTSGLPDMLPENQALREQHAPLSAFVDGTCRTPLLFAAGHGVRYQSMGTLLAAAMVEHVSGRTLPELMATEIFTPLEMTATHLGIRDDLEERTAHVCLPAEQEGTNWHWNTDYWRRLSAPWGGMFSTVDDLLRLLSAMLHGGRLEECRVLGSATSRAMIADQTAALPELSERDRRTRRWGLGWRLGAWGDLGSPRSFSHGGATGTMVGADPESGLACAIFTTRPGAPLQRVVTAVQAAITDTGSA